MSASFYEIIPSSRWGMLNLVNQLFKIYFKLNKLHLTKPLIRAVDSSPLRDKYELNIISLPISEAVTFLFQVL